MRAERGGHTLKTGKIGRVNCLRQQLLMPGERMNMSLNGKVRLEALRERDVMRINAHLATFMTPLRWLVPVWPDFVKEGPFTGNTIPQEQWQDLSTLGIGAYAGDVAVDWIYSHFADNYLRVVNEWYKWPESREFDRNDLYVDGNGAETGVPAVPLSKTWSRLRLNATPTDETDYKLASGTEIDVRDLAVTQARFRSAMKRDVLSFKRWMELINETWKGDGSREVDQVPIMLDQTEIGVNPREIPATDGASLGTWQSLFDFGIDHQIPGIVAPEHCIVSTFLTVRFAANVEQKHPLAAAGRHSWFDQVGDPEYISNAMPQPVEAADLFLNASETVLGYAPAGWQWRCDNDVIGKAVDSRDSFPYSLVPTSPEQCKDATRVKNAFRSQDLDDYLVDVYIKESSNQPIGDSMDSYFSGMMDDVQVKTGGKGKEFPKGGKQL